MNMTVQEYTEYKLKRNWSDKRILERLGYSPNSTRLLRKWKRANGVEGAFKLELLDKKQIKKELETHSIRWASIKYRVDYGHFRKWVYTWIYKEEI